MPRGTRLPAIYTEVLAPQDLSTAACYAYLLLYIAAYLFDDTLLVAAVVVTLDKRKLQERGGRWLKRFSDLVITALGLAMLLRPRRPAGREPLPRGQVSCRAAGVAGDDG